MARREKLCRRLLKLEGRKDFRRFSPPSAIVGPSLFVPGSEDGTHRQADRHMLVVEAGWSFTILRCPSEG